MGRGYRVLLVDDEAAMRATMSAVLSESCEVTTACSAEEALFRLTDMSFDVVCTDFAMKGRMTGLDLLAAVAERPEPIGKVLVTGQTNVGESSSLCYVLLKPCDPQRLIDVVHRAAGHALSLRRVNAAAAESRRALGQVTTGRHVRLDARAELEVRDAVPSLPARRTR